VVVDEALRRARRAGDVLHPHLVVAAGHEQFEGRGEELLAADLEVEATPRDLRGRSASIATSTGEHATSVPRNARAGVLVAIDHRSIDARCRSSAFAGRRDP